MRFLFGLALGLLIPVTVRAVKNTGRTVALEPIRGGLAKSDSKKATEPQVKDAVKKSRTSGTSGTKARQDTSGTQRDVSEKPEESGKADNENGSQE